MDSTDQKSKENKIILILRWVFGISLVLNGIGSIFSEPISGLIMLVMAAILLPPVSKLVEKRWKFRLSKGVKIAILIVGFIILGVTDDTSNVSNTQQTETQKEEQITDNKTATDEAITDNQVDEEKAEAPEETKPATSVDTDQSPTPIKTEDKPEPTPTPTPTETVSQKNVVAKAKAYLDYSAFSRDGLVEQLEYEQFSHADAVYGTDNCGANWNEQAAKKAESYMEYSAFSRGSLIEQLKYEGFTQAQAEYGADAVGL